MKICIMTSVHKNDDVRIYYKQANSLKKAGYEITFINPYLESIDEFGIVLKKINIPKKRASRIINSPFIMLKKALNENADVYHFHDPELILTGLLLKICGKKVVYDVHEDVPRNILSKPYLKPFIAKVSSKFMEGYELFCAKRFDLIISATPIINKRFEKLKTKALNINNYPILDEFSEIENDYKNKKDQICYIGELTKIRGIFELIEANKYIKKAKIALAGRFENEQIKDFFEQNNFINPIEYKGFLNRKEISELLFESKAGLVTLHPTDSYKVSLPIKMFEYMAAGLPIICSNFDYWKEIVEKYDCGICVDPLNPKEIAQAIDFIIDNPEKARLMGENGKKIVFEKLNWKMEEQKLLDSYKLVFSNAEKNK